MEISLHILELLLQQSARLGALKTLCACGKIRPYIKQSEAFRLYGKRTVLGWLDEGLITPYKDGDLNASWRLDRIQVASLNASLELIKHIHYGQLITKSD
ncbi:hypothetical protein [Pedobacter sp. GR22-6]|uniref:hypothetical protein n=1 Tax=Pedobacter sp. GR22-6 TaxID=3127957 RepID=UPI00307D0DBD